jgi:DNA gyrase inhibitor GyrI
MTDCTGGQNGWFCLFVMAQSMLSKESLMNPAAVETLDVRIVELPHLRVASVVGKGPEPELAGWTVLLTWAKANGYLKEPRRFFGHNIWLPHDSSSSQVTHDYEVWMTLEPDENPGRPVMIKNFRGGLYATLRVENVQNIPGAWDKLMGWLKHSAYHQGTHQWLEEHVRFIDIPVEEFVLELYLPITV